MLADKSTELSRIKLKTWTRQPVLWSASIQPTWPHCQLTLKVTSCVSLLNAGFERAPDTKSPLDWMLTTKPTELSRIKLKTWTRQPVPMISDHTAHLTPLSVAFCTWLWRYTYLLLLISMLWHRQAIFKSKGDKLCSSAECRIWTRGPRCQIASRLNARWQTYWAIEDQAKNLNSTARPYDQQAFSPLDPLSVDFRTWLWRYTYLFLLISMFLAQASDIQIERRQVVFLCWMQDLKPGAPDTKSPADWMLADKPTELSKIKLKTWTRQPVPMISGHSAHLTPLSVDFKVTSCVSLLNAGFEPGAPDAKSPLDWMLTNNRLSYWGSS